MEKESFIKTKSAEALQKQLEAVNTIRLRDGREVLYANPEDFTMTEQQLKEKYGEQYEKFKADLKTVIKERIENANSEKELREVARETLSPRRYQQYQQKIQNAPEKELSKKKSILSNVVLLSMGLSLGLGVVEWISRASHAARVSVGKNNPILAAQSAGRLIFKDDNGAHIEFSFPERNRQESRSYGSVEQVILDPDSFHKEDDIENVQLEEKYEKEEITFQEYKDEHWEIENRKRQGYLNAYEKHIVSFEKIVEGIKEAGERGIKTTLNFGDSSTSGWNSEILTENTIEAARLIYAQLRKEDATLPETFDDFVKSKHPGEYDSRGYITVMSTEAERLKKHPKYQQILDKHWDEFRKVTNSPFMTYDTYSDKMAQIDTKHHYVNLGVPGYSSVHAQAYVRRMLDKLEQAGALQYVDSVTLYFGNNDSVNNGNREDKYYLGDSVRTNFHALGLLHENLPGIFNTTRVQEDDYRENITSTVMLLKERGIQNITLFVPVVPLDWIPGKRSENDAQEVIEEQYRKGGKASKELDIAHDKHVEYGLAVDNVDDPNFENGREFGQEALERDFMVPRRKEAYVKKLAEVAKEQGINLVNLESLLPIRDMSGFNTKPKNPENITNDYCHPGEHVNILLALAQAALVNENIEEIKSRALEKLTALQENTDQPIPQEVLKGEIDYVVTRAIASKESPEAYNKLANSQRMRHTWKSALNFN